MKLLMTGGSGFLGQYVRLVAEANKHEFVSYDMTSGKDILDRDSFYLDCVEHKPDVVIHAAAVADLYESEAMIDRNFSINVQGTYIIARICSILEIPLIYISTCCAYGNQSERKLTDEQTEPIPTETYAWSKLAGEKVLGCAGQLKGFILRLGTFYGPGMRDALFNARAIQKAMSDEIIEIHGDGEQTRRYIHAADVARAIVKFSEHINDVPSGVPINPLPIFNIIGDEEISVNDTVRIIGEILDRPVRITHVGQRNGQITRQLILGQEAKRFADWRPGISYREGMEGCINWYRSEVVQNVVIEAVKVAAKIEGFEK